MGKVSQMPVCSQDELDSFSVLARQDNPERRSSLSRGHNKASSRSRRSGTQPLVCKKQRERCATNQITGDAAKDHFAQARMPVGTEGEHGRAAPPGGRHERVAIRLIATANRYHPRYKAVPGKVAGYVGTRLRSMPLQGWFCVENKDINACSWRRKGCRIAKGMRCFPSSIPADREMFDRSCLVAAWQDQDRAAR